MSIQVRYVLLSTLLGAGIFTLLSFLWAFLWLQIKGSGPHGYGVFIYILVPVYFTPAGTLVGFLASIFRKEPNYKASLLWSLGSFFCVVVAYVVWTLASRP